MTSDGLGGGLRERKKVRTRAAIQQAALRLFRDHGYQATTIEQVAEASEVSVKTLYRYFATKEELITVNLLDPVIIDGFRAQPGRLAPVGALRATLGDAVRALSEAALADQRERLCLLLTVPRLWASGLDNVVGLIGGLAEVIAERTGHAPDDSAVRSQAGAIVGVLVAVWLDWADHPDAELADALDTALAGLESGWPELQVRRVRGG